VDVSWDTVYNYFMETHRPYRQSKENTRYITFYQ